jgi:hypothetical protein
MDSKHNAFETVTEILTESPKDEVRNVVCIGRKDPSGSWTTMESSVPIN